MRNGSPPLPPPEAEAIERLRRSPRLWVLGARDPEMQFIARLLERVGEHTNWLGAAGKRCYPGNAYRGDPPAALADTAIVRVECDWAGSSAAFVVDHHHPGDPGFGVAPARYMHGASLGQIIGLLGRLAALRPLQDAPDAWEWRGDGAAEIAAAVGDLGFDGERWWVRGALADYALPDRVLMVAAGDHCLGAAYRGECPGVEPDALLRFRARQDAVWRGVSDATVRSDLERARRALERAPRLRLGVGVEVADMRTSSLPELNEAAARWGLPYVGELEDRSGRIKVVLRVADVQILAAWDGWARDQGLVDCYGGDPARGFAGGYRARTSARQVAHG